MSRRTRSGRSASIISTARAPVVRFAHALDPRTIDQDLAERAARERLILDDSARILFNGAVMAGPLRR
jgi:hypothetical protein